MDDTCEDAAWVPRQIPTRGRRFYPYEEILCDVSLDGSMGRTRVHRDDSQCPLANDFQAATEWLKRFERPRTHRQFRKVLDTLFNWAVFARRLAVSSFTTEDFAQFDRYLAEPTLWDPPCRRCGVIRGEPGWQPIRSAQSLGSRRSMIGTVKSFSKWMGEVGYADLCVEAPRRSRHVRSAFTSSSASSSLAALPEPVSLESWIVFKRSASTWPNSIMWLRTRAMIDLLYHADLILEEVLSLDYGVVAAALNGPAPPSIQVPRRAGVRGTVYLVPQVRASVGAWIAAMTERVGLACAVRFGSREQCNNAFNRAKFLAAAYARERGWQKAADELQGLTPKRLHRALSNHAEQMMWGNLAWRLCGSSVLSKSRFDDWFPREPLSAEQYAGLCERLHEYQRAGEAAVIEKLQASRSTRTMIHRLGT